MTSSMVCDSNTASLDYQEQKTFSSNHPSSWRNVLKDILVEWFEPENLYLSAIGMQIIATLLLKNRSYNFPGNKKKKTYIKKTMCKKHHVRKYLSLCSRLHRCLNHFMWSPSKRLHTISIRRTMIDIQGLPRFSVNLPFELSHPFIERFLLIVGSFSRLLCISQNLLHNRTDLQHFSLKKQWNIIERKHRSCGR